MRLITLPDDLKSELQQSDTNSAKRAFIRTISMVGAIADDGTLSRSDSSYLKDIFDICAHYGIKVEPEVKVGAINLEYGHDFLENPVKADLTVFSYIFHSPAKNIPTQNFVNQSTKAQDPASWHNALLKTGSNIAVNVYNGSGLFELPTSYLAKHPYHRIATMYSQNIDMNYALLMR